MKKLPGQAKVLNIVLAIIVIVILIVAATSWSKYKKQNNAGSTTTTTSDAAAQPVDLTKTFTYQGQEGKTAFSLLQDNIKNIEYTSTDFGAYVTGIGDITAPDGYFWAMYVNDKLSAVGASDYVTHDGDTIRWQLDKIDTSSE